MPGPPLFSTSSGCRSISKRLGRDRIFRSGRSATRPSTICYSRWSPMPEHLVAGSWRRHCCSRPDPGSRPTCPCGCLGCGVIGAVDHNCFRQPPGKCCSADRSPMRSFIFWPPIVSGQHHSLSTPMRSPRSSPSSCWVSMRLRAGSATCPPVLPNRCVGSQAPPSPCISGICRSCRCSPHSPRGRPPPPKPGRCC